MRLLLGIGLMMAMPHTNAVSANETSGLPFAIVELFTSEGCSSCPPADKLLNSFAADADKNGARVFPLAFHVDYWNHLGWRDPFSAPQYTQRQEAYSRATHNRGLYTPQMIVNGTDAFVGSDRVHAHRAIADPLKQSAAVELKLRAIATTNHSVAVAYEITGAPKNPVLNIALVESGLVQKISRGENAARTLRHNNVVRSFRWVSPDESGHGTIELVLPAGVDGARIKVIGFAQDAGRSRGRASRALSCFDWATEVDSARLAAWRN
jgi:hypothetical protein